METTRLITPEQVEKERLLSRASDKALCEAHGKVWKAAKFKVQSTTGREHTNDIEVHEAAIERTKMLLKMCQHNMRIAQRRKSRRQL